MWNNHEEQFPLLAPAVCDVYSVLSASYKSERVFSYAGNMVTSLQNRLNAEKVENFIKLNVNLLKEIGKLK